MFRWGGDSEPTGEQGCTLKEATIALACANSDSWYAVQAKREISVLWDTESARYKAVFYPDLTATKIWNAVKIMRAVDKIVDFHASDLTTRADMVGSHMQRIVLHIVFQDPVLDGWDTATDSNGKLADAEASAARIFEAVRQDVVKNHPTEYLASLSKNFDKCEVLVRRILFPGSTKQSKDKDPQGKLFGEQEPYLPESAQS